MSSQIQIYHLSRQSKIKDLKYLRNPTGQIEWFVVDKNQNILSKHPVKDFSKNKTDPKVCNPTPRPRRRLPMQDQDIVSRSRQRPRLPPWSWSCSSTFSLALVLVNENTVLYLSNTKPARPIPILDRLDLIQQPPSIIFPAFAPALI